MLSFSAMAMLSVVLPIYNEQEVIPELYRRVTESLTKLLLPYEVIAIDDGSRDSSLVQLVELNRKDSRWKIISMSRNFGHQAAITAGMSHCSGEVIAILDADLQDPPEELWRFIAKWREGYDVVYAVRRKRKEGFVKRSLYFMFYRILRKMVSIEIPLDAGDFCVMDRAVVDVLNSLPEKARFVRALRSWAGFRQIGVEYERHARQHGEPKYTFSKLVKLALDGLVSFSNVPLRLASWVGFTLCFGALLLGALSLAWYASNLHILGMHPRQAIGWSSLFVGLMFFSGIQMLLVGIQGEYLARIFDEVKDRAAFVVREAIGFAPQSSPASPSARRTEDRARKNIPPLVV